MNDDDLRITCLVNTVTTTGFKFEVSTWGATHVWRYSGIREEGREREGKDDWLSKIVVQLDGWHTTRMQHKHREQESSLVAFL